MICAYCLERFPSGSINKCYDNGLNRWFCSAHHLILYTRKQDALRRKRRLEVKEKAKQKALNGWMVGINDD